jgi:hypothetical protein
MSYELRATSHEPATAAKLTWSVCRGSRSRLEARGSRLGAGGAE